MNRIVLSIVSLLVWPLLSMAAVRPVKVALKEKPNRTTRADDPRQGVRATLRYEQAADMAVARMAHQTFPSGDGLVVVGGRTTGFQLTKTAELWQNGTWTTIPIASAHDGAFAVRLSDGRYMVGGGFASAGGVGQTKVTDIYDPTTRTFATGPQLTTARAQSMAMAVGSQVYVSGNWYADDPTMDFYDGASFKAVAQTDGRTSPYMMYDADGNIYAFSSLNERGQSFGYYTDDDGEQLLVDRYSPATGETRYLALPFTSENSLLPLSDDVRPSDYHVVYSGYNCYLLLSRAADGCRLYMLNLDQMGLYRFQNVVIPTTDEEGRTITWRGGVLTNSVRQEAYLIGASGPAARQTLHLISLNYDTDEWTLATATGFSHNLLSASWTVLSDGRLACTGGSVNDNTDARPTVYLFTPPVAGQGDTEPDPGPLVDRNYLVVETKNHVLTTYMLAERPQVRFEGANLRVVSAKADVTYRLSDILRFTYEKRSVTGVSELQAEPAAVDYEDGELVISGLKAGAAVGVYSLDGKLVRQLTARHAGTYRLSLAALPQGVYIVKADNITYKIMKR